MTLKHGPTPDEGMPMDTMSEAERRWREHTGHAPTPQTPDALLAPYGDPMPPVPRLRWWQRALDYFGAIR